MRVSIALIFVAFHVVVGYPYRAIDDDCFRDGLAQGYIRYIDANGAQRLVEYNYPNPIYNLQHSTYESQRHAGVPFLKSNIQPIFSGPEYIYQGSIEDQVARDQHFRTWNLQRYQALKNEVDRLYFEGKIPSSDMLNRLQQLEKFSAKADFVPSNEEPEMKQAHEEHLKLWNKARLNVLKEQAAVNNENQPARDAHLRLYDQQVQLLQRYENDKIKDQHIIVESLEDQHDKEEHLRLVNEAKVPAVNVNQQNSQGSSSEVAANVHYFQSPALKSAETHQIVSGISNKIVNEPAHHHEHTFEGKILVETPEVQQAKEEHLRLWNLAKIRAEKADHIQSESIAPQVAQKFGADHVTAFKSAVEPQIEKSKKIGSDPIHHHEQAFDGKILVETPEVQRAKEEHFRLWNEAKIRAEEADKAQAAEQSNVFGTLALKFSSETSSKPVFGEASDSSAFQEIAELEAQKVREMERLREEEKILEMDSLKEAERLKEEKEKMKAEQMFIQSADEARLQKDLKEQFEGEHVRKVATEVVSPSGLYLLSKRYTNPFLYQYNTPAAAVRFAGGQQHYFKYPGAYAVQASRQQLLPSFVYNDKLTAAKFIPQQYLPATSISQQIHQSKEAKDLHELEQATREHFHAHEIALKQLGLVNQQASPKDCTH